MLMRPLMFRGAAGGAAALRPQDVYQTVLYTSAGESPKTVSSAITPDLVWGKQRNSQFDHQLFDSKRGAGKILSTNSTGAESNFPDQYGSISTNQFSDTGYNSGDTVSNWLFRRAPKFFDIVTYTGDGTSGRQIPHGLGIPPGMVIVKRRDGAVSWRTYHRAAPGQAASLEDTGAFFTDSGTLFGNGSSAVAPGSTSFTVGQNVGVNASGATYVAYLFAHDPDPVNGIVQCGSFTTDNTGESPGLVPLPWRPQYVLVKPSTVSGNWEVLDTTRGWVNAGGGGKVLRPNTSEAELSVVRGEPDNLGFYWAGGAASATYVYLAIRAPI